MKRLLFTIILFNISQAVLADTLAGIDYECREAKIDLKQDIENPMPIMLHGKDRVSWYEANRKVSNRIKGRLQLNDGVGSAENGKLRLNARGITFPDGPSIIDVNVEYLLASTPKSQSHYRAGSSFALRGDEIGAMDFSDAGEYNVHIQCSFSPVK